MENAWSLDIEKIFHLLGSTREGYSTHQATIKLKSDGFNRLTKAKTKPLLFKFIAQLANPLIILLLFTGLLSIILGQKIDSIVILIILFASISLDVFQQDRAQKATEKLMEKTALKAVVLRDGTKTVIPATEIVTGDIVYVSTGSVVPADGRILESVGLQVNQSVLTGESLPQLKKAEILPDESTSISTQTNMVFSGTEVVSGEATLLITATGSNTQLGTIATKLTEKRPKTEFEIGINNFGLMLSRLTLVMVSVLFILNLLLGHPIIGSLLFILSLAIGLAPELLPMIITINLSNGAIKMSKKGVIVKNLTSIENFGSIDLLCTDKTGTLTENAIHLESYENAEGEKDKDVIQMAYLNSYFQSGLKGSMEQAVINENPGTNGYQKEKEVAFDFYRKILSVVVSNNKERWLITKGAPEEIIPRCSSLDSVGKEKILARFLGQSQAGFRILAVAVKKIDEKEEYSTQDEKNLSFLGLLFFSDPPKVSAKQAIESFGKSGVGLKILTGDGQLVTQYVCEKLNISVTGCLSGEELQVLDDTQLKKVIEGITIFYRLNPDQKSRIVTCLRECGHVVGFLGDGVNDAPSLRASDVGISVDNAVDVAKEAADFILLHKDLMVLHEGIIEGRKTFGNIIKYIKMGVSSTFGNMISMAAASLLLPFLPLLPVQVLLGDLLYDLSQLLLTRDGVDRAYLEKPKKWNIKSIRDFMFVFGPVNSLFDFFIMFILLYIFKASVPLFQTGWFLESLIAQTLIVLSIRTRMVPFYKSKPDKVFAAGLFAIALFGLILPYSPLADIFHLVKPPVIFYFWLTLMIIGYFLLVEKVKKIYYARAID